MAKHQKKNSKQVCGRPPFIQFLDGSHGNDPLLLTNGWSFCHRKCGQPTSRQHKQAQIIIFFAFFFCSDTLIYFQFSPSSIVTYHFSAIWPYVNTKHSRWLKVQNSRHFTFILYPIKIPFK